MKRSIDQFLGCYSFLITQWLIVLASLNKRATSTNYTVGDAEEWGIGTNYMTWSEKYNFTVGDVLVFRYVKGQHNAYEVTKEAYRSCNESKGVIRKYESGNDAVVLKEARTYWFICSIPGHCLGGMKFGVDAAQGIGIAPVSDHPPSDGAVHVDRGKKYWVFTVALGVLLVMNS